MTASSELLLEGGCDCRYIRYRISGEPLIVHCCHCKWCQRETGSAFVINALFTTDHVINLGANPDIISTPSQSGRGQDIARCPKCHLAVWSNYGGGGQLVRFVRVGTLDEPQKFVPDVHIYTESKVPWVELPQDAPTFKEFYDARKVWAREADERRYAVMLKIQAAQTPQATSPSA